MGQKWCCLRLLHAPSGQKDGHLIKAPQQKHFQRGSTCRISTTFLCDESFPENALYSWWWKLDVWLRLGIHLTDSWCESHQLCEEDYFENPIGICSVFLEKVALFKLSILRFHRVGNLASLATRRIYVGCIKIKQSLEPMHNSSRR